MYYAQFYQLSTGYVPGSIPPKFDPKLVALVPAVGSEQILKLDGRLHRATHLQQATEHARRLGFKAFSFHKADRIIANPQTAAKYTVSTVSTV